MVFDIALNTDNASFKIENGDFVAEVSDNQHIYAICKSKKGDWKESLLVGVGIDDYLNSAGVIQDLDVEIRKQIEADSANINFMKLTENTSGTFELAINAEY